MKTKMLGIACINNEGDRLEIRNYDVIENEGFVIKTISNDPSNKSDMWFESIIDLQNFLNEVIEKIEDLELESESEQ